MASLPDAAAPGGFIPYVALSHVLGNGSDVPVTGAHPLPVRVSAMAAQSTPLSGTTSATAMLGPFVPELGRPIWLTLSGNWAGSAILRRSVDGGATKLPATLGGETLSYGANLNEPVTEETEAAAAYYLDVTLASGSLAYRIAQ